MLACGSETLLLVSDSGMPVAQLQELWHNICRDYVVDGASGAVQLDSPG